MTPSPVTALEAEMEAQMHPTRAVQRQTEGMKPRVGVGTQLGLGQDRA